ncbi:hypothetical protein BLNAU_12421 [Blattamonas nauphoetae]|uniref:Tail specific protease domain-containing protein n=1 Tax=Blattamonas nauphoetae TaxID=2049346 RepID=A0ABQ9XMN3_9EUKA|nr:hypothetical protein BLNAU_12421 [Blattamonas nauphoetae]
MWQYLFMVPAIQLLEFSLSIIEECYDTIPFDEIEAVSTMYSILQILNEYSFGDTLRNPPEDAGVPKMDLVARLEALDLEEMNSMFKFYSAIHKIVDSARDAHLQFIAPCEKVFLQYFPYDLSIETTNPPILVLREFRSLPSLSEDSNKKLGFDLIGAKVHNLSLNTEFDPTKTPFDVLSDWAEENVFAAKRKTNRFNRAILGEFVYRRALKAQTAEVKMMVTLTNGEQKTVTVPFGVYINTDESKIFLEDKCPLKLMNNEPTTPAHTLKLDEILRKNDEIIQYVLSPARQLISSTNHTIPSPPSNSDYFTPIIMSEYGITSAVVPTEKIGYLHIGSFSNDKYGLAIAYILSLKGITAKKCDKLILDLRGNGGGDITLTIQMMELLWPNRIPHTFQVDYPVTTWNDIYEDFFDALSDPSLDPTTLKPTNMKTDRVLKNFTHINGTEYQRTYSKRSVFGGGEDVIGSSLRKFWNRALLKRKTPLFPPENIVMLTDGRCGSACGMFIKTARAHRLGRVAYMGGYPIDTEPTDIDIGEFSGGSVLTASKMPSIAAVFGEPCPIDPFVRMTTDMTFTNTIVYSNEEGKENEMWEFSRVTPSVVKRLYKNAPASSEADMKELVELVKDEFGKCDVGMFKESSTCNKLNKNNKLSAHPCSPDTSTFDTSTCVAAGCVARHWSVDGECVASPLLSRKEVELRSWWERFGWIVIVVVVALVLVVVILIAACVCSSRRRNKDKDGLDIDQQPTDYDMMAV